MVIAHLSDLHFGLSSLSKRTADGSRNQREADFERAALLAARYLVEEVKPDLTVVAGDALHTTRISTPGLMGAREFCHLHRDAGIPLVISGGNHDQVQSPVPPMLSLLAADGAHVALEQETLDVAGVRLHLLPYRPLELALRGDGHSEFDFSAERPNVLVAHGSVEGYDFREDDVEIPGYWVEDPRFALVCLGHVHARARLGDLPAFYAGCIERIDFGEVAQSPGFWLHTINDSGALVESREVEISALARQYGVPMTPRPMRQWKINADKMTLTQLDERVRREVFSNPERLDGALGRLVISNVSSAFTHERYRADWKALFAESGGFDLDVEARTAVVESLLVEGEFSAPPVDLAVGFAEFMRDQDGIPEDERSDLAELGRDVLQSARESLMAGEE